MKKVILLLALLLFTILGLIDLSYAKKAKPPAGDKDEIKRMAERDFETIVALWKDEDYERLYEYGRLSSHTKVSKEAFSKRMKNKRWKLMCFAVMGRRRLRRSINHLPVCISRQLWVIRVLLRR